jgi:signal transduction histidine kinase/ActR/RegA family two-component response regulator
VGKETKSGLPDDTTELQPLYHQIIEHSPLAIASSEGPQHILRYVNPAFCRLVEKGPEELIGIPFAHAVPEAASFCVPHLDQVQGTGETVTCVTQIQSAPRPLYWSLTVWVDSDALTRPLRIIIQVTDITQAELIHEKLTAVNEQLMLASVRQHELTEEAEKLNAELQEEIDRRKRVEEELRQSRDNLEQRVKERTAELSDMNARLKKEIVEHEQAEEALRKSEERFRAFVTTSSDVVYRMSPDWTEMRHLVGKDFVPDAEKPKATWLDGYIPPDDQPHVKAVINAAIRNKSIFELEHRVIRVDDTVGWTFSRAVPLLDGRGEIVEWFGTARDITERKRADEELKKAKDKLELQAEELQGAYDRLLTETEQRRKVEEQLAQAQKMEAVGTLAGGIAHDFNNMLAVILGNAELALDDIDETNGAMNASRHNIERIVEASKRSRDLVKQILTFSRKSESRKRKPLKISPLLKETVKLLRGSLPTTITISLDIATDADTILGDPSHIQQILMNLASNAAYAMREDGGTLTIRLSRITFNQGDSLLGSDMRPGRYLKLSVRDTGPGIPKKVRTRIFEPFFTTKKAGEGTGMGLALVFGLVKGHEGAITVESEPGEGATFNIFFPAQKKKAEEETYEQDSLPRGNESILLVDDEPLVVDMAKETLQRLGYAVTTAPGGSEGWRLFELDPDGFDLVITDHVMPDMTGMRLAERILEVREDFPIILFTGYSETVSSEKARAAGISAFVMKPVAKRELAETVRRVLDKK